MQTDALDVVHSFSLMVRIVNYTVFLITACNVTLILTFVRSALKVIILLVIMKFNVSSARQITVKPVRRSALLNAWSALQATSCLRTISA